MVRPGSRPESRRPISVDSPTVKLFRSKGVTQILVIMMSQGTAASAIGQLKTKMGAMKKEIDDLKDNNEKLCCTIREKEADNFRVGNVLRLSGM